MKGEDTSERKKMANGKSAEGIAEELEDIETIEKLIQEIDCS